MCGNCISLCHELNPFHRIQVSKGAVPACLSWTNIISNGPATFLETVVYERLATLSSLAMTVVTPAPTPNEAPGCSLSSTSMVFTLSTFYSVAVVVWASTAIVFSSFCGGGFYQLPRRILTQLAHSNSLMRLIF